MSTASDHCRVVLAAIIPNRRDLLDQALRHLTPDHFPDPTLRNFFIMLERYGEVTGSVLTRDALTDMLVTARADAGKMAMYQETYDSLSSRVASESSFLWSLEQIRELAADRATGDALTQAMEILTRGVEKEGKDPLKGHRDARLHVLSRFAEIDRSLSMQDAPEGDMRIERDDIFADYNARKKAHESGEATGIRFGIPELDAKLGPLQRGELILLGAATSEGKTSLAVQLGWSAAVEQKRNVVILTTETVRSQVRRRTVARHSCLKHFQIKDGLNSKSIKEGTLTDEQIRQFYQVVTDFTTNPGYGHYYIVQVPRGATVGYIESKLVRIQRLFPIDLVIVDYLTLFQADRRRSTDREELSSILRDAKQLAHTFNGGLGVPLVSPWQVSRAAREEAEKTKSYKLSAFSETSEAEKSSDILIMMLAPLDNTSRIAPLNMQILKHRDGEKAQSIQIMVDYATSRFFSADGGSTVMDNLFCG